MNTKSKSKTAKPPQPPTVRIEYCDQQAQAVAIVGTFNDWRPQATPMLALSDGRWVKELVLPPGCYEYRFVVDGEWKSDPAEPEQVPNPYGTRNSVLEVPGPAVPAPDAQAR
jgi:5'-AMP-activated protein kinase regulatory beta subunit